MDLLLQLQQKQDMALMLITHDLAVVAEAAHKIIVMYAGQIVETGTVDEVFQSPRHPYTAALLEALPERSVGHERLTTIPGVVPRQFARPTGCLLNPRCESATAHRVNEAPILEQLDDHRQARCPYPR